jgi:hypothetical protein
MRECKIIAKIENMEGLVNYREIMDECDVMLLSRGSMGNCVDPEKMFLAQKMLLRVRLDEQQPACGHSALLGLHSNMHAGIGFGGHIWDVCSQSGGQPPAACRTAEDQSVAAGRPAMVWLCLVAAYKCELSGVVVLYFNFVCCAGVQPLRQAHLRYTCCGHNDRCTPPNTC